MEFLCPPRADPIRAAPFNNQGGSEIRRGRRNLRGFRRMFSKTSRVRMAGILSEAQRAFPARGHAPEQTVRRWLRVFLKWITVREHSASISRRINQAIRRVWPHPACALQGIAMFRKAVRETVVPKNRAPGLEANETRFAEHGLITPPASDVITPERFHHRRCRVLVATTTDPRHHRGMLLFGESVRQSPSLIRLWGKHPIV